MRRRLLHAAALATLLAVVPAAVSAHPLGNFTINHFAGITVTPDAIHLDVVVDRAEIPTFQERRRIDVDEDGQVSAAETSAAVGPACEALGTDLRLLIDGAAVEPERGRSRLTFPGGLGGLPTMRLECAFSAPLALRRDRATRIEFSDGSDAGRAGWREIVIGGDGARVEARGALPASISKRLTAYPDDLLDRPLDIRSVTIEATAAPGGRASELPATASGPGGLVPGGVGEGVPALFGSADVTPLVLVGSLVLAVLLGAQHALTPGHGKTLMAAYLIGSRGRLRHALVLGLAVSVSHTIGILVLAAVIVGAERVLPAEVVVRAASLVAAVGIVGVGAWMLVGEVRRRRGPEPGRTGTMAGNHRHSDNESHDHQRPVGAALGWRGLFGLGFAGGLIPSTSALLILLASIVTGRPTFGFVLVVAFGSGMAAVMAAVGVAVVVGRSRLERSSASPRFGRLAAGAPLGAALFVLAVGVVLTAQAIAAPPRL